MLNAKSFTVEAIDEIIAPIEIWGQRVDLVLCIEFDEDEDDETRYIEKALAFIDRNINLILDKVDYVDQNKDSIFRQLLEENPVDYVEDCIHNLLDSVSATQFTLEDSTTIDLPLTEETFLDKLLVCEAVHFVIVAEEEENPELEITVSFGTVDDITGGHGWDIEVF